jgi:hypothetical protein
VEEAEEKKLTSTTRKIKEHLHKPIDMKRLFV